mgnify:CR=1 FL=1
MPKPSTVEKTNRQRMRLEIRLRLMGVAALVALQLPAAAFGEGELAEAVVNQREMIVTANPLASAAGAKILKNGGTAADAMVAAQTVLGLVEPQASGLGGGAFVVYYDAATGQTTTFDAREKAPAAAAGSGGTSAFSAGSAVRASKTSSQLCPSMTFTS